jgi:hypothetical protein
MPHYAIIQGSVVATVFAECLTQRFRRAFPERFPVFNRKAPEFNKAQSGRDFGDGDGPTTGHHQLFSCAGQLKHSKATVRRQTVDPVKSFTQGSLADGQRSTQRCNVKRGLKVSQGQSLSVRNQVTTATCGRAKPQGQRWRVLPTGHIYPHSCNHNPWHNRARTGVGMILPFGPTYTRGG